ncbi:MAG: GNAT family N-acetyltransferase [Anaerolineae bacterium]|nr:GNAT family N-acetyltransferase [Anaerolineae bacterium]
MSEDIRARFFPMSLPAGVIGQWVIRSEATADIQELNAQIFRSAELRLFQVPPERQSGVQHLKQGYVPAQPECVVFYSDARLPVGWFYSYREDATTAFIDTVGFLPSYRGRGLYSAFLPKYLAYVAALGIERVTTSHHPNNRAIMIAELKVGFNVVGLELHESHGPLIKMAYFMHADRRAGFEQAFSMAPDPTAGIKR